MEWLTNPEIWVAFFTLTALEIVLGIDNIIMISILVSRMPKHMQARTRIFGLALAGIEFGDHQRFTLKWAVLVCLCIMFAALLMGIFPLFSTL